MEEEDRLMAVRFMQNTKAPSRRIGGQLAVITPRTGHVHKLNGLGTFLWERCGTDGATHEELVGAVLDVYDVSHHQAFEDVDVFLKDAVEKGVLVCFEGERGTSS